MDTPLKSVADVSARLRAVAAEMNAVSTAKAGAKGDLTELATKGSLLLSELKAAARNTLLAVERQRQEVATARDALDAHHLQLQNLLYEKNHLQREIQECQDFSTAELDKIELVPDAVFAAEAPARLQGAADVASDASEADRAAAAHRHKMNRLTFELETRKRLDSELSDRKLRRKALAGMTAQKRKFLAALPQKLEGVVKAVAPVSQYLSLPSHAKVERQREAQQLPRALFVLFCQLDALGNATDDAITVRVAPSVTTSLTSVPGEAEASKSSRGRKRGRASDDDDDDDDDDDGTSGTASSSKRKRLTSSGASATGGGAGGGAGASATGADSASESGKHVPYTKLFEPHESAVMVEVRQQKSGGATTSLRFQYLPRLDIVTVQVEGGGSTAELLTNLFPNDTGTDTPRLSNHHLVAAGHSSTSRVLTMPPELPGRPFKWAQWMCGLYLMNSASDGSAQARNEPTVRRVVAAVRTRMMVRSGLGEQLAALSATPARVPVHADAEALFPSTAPIANLVAWSKTAAPKDARLFVSRGAAAVAARAAAAHAAASGAAVGPVEGDDSSDSDSDGGGAAREAAAAAPELNSMPADELEWVWVQATFYRAVFEGPSGLVQALVSVPSEYPVRPSCVRLCHTKSVSTVVDVESAAFDSTLQSVETEVNAYASRLVPTPASQPHLLSHQLRAVQMGIAGASTGASTGAAAQRRVRRGRDRRPALVFDAATNAFVHR